MLHIRKNKLTEAKGYIVWTETYSGLHETVDSYNLNPKDSKFFSSLKSNQRKNEYLATRILLKNVAPLASIKYDKIGRPSLIDSDLYISISHSKNIVSIITSNTPETAIDVQVFDEKVLGLRKKFLSAKEQKMIIEDDVKQNSLAWSIKESLFKSIRQENVPFESCLNIENINNNRVDCSINHPNIKKKLTVNYKLFDTFVMTYIC
jgi:4'-phosphopantetheinyl transferase